MSEEQQAAEISRLLACEARRASPFEFLQLDIATCELSDVNRQYRKIALLLHPDKCSLPNASDAFHAAEKVHKSLSQEPIFYHLKRAFQKQQDRLVEEGELKQKSGGASGPSHSSASSNSVGQKRARETEVELPPITFGSLSQLATSGLSTDAQKASEIRRVLQCKPTDYFIILDVDPAMCTVADVDRRYRKMAQALHPDKCQLPHVDSAFTVFERAHKELADEKKLVRFKVAFEQQRRKEAALRAATLVQNRSGGNGSSGGCNSASLTAEERLQQRKMEALRNQQFEAMRLGEEAARRRREKEEKEKEDAELAAELERQRKEWSDLQLF